MKIGKLMLSGVLIFTCGCNGNGSSKQEMSGTIDRSSCESAGLGYAEGNPILGTQNRCISKGSEQENCNSQNQIYDPAAQHCVDGTDDDYPQIFFSKDFSVVDSINISDVTICVGGPAYKLLSEEMKASIKESITTSVNAWIEPLKAFAKNALPQNITIVEAPDICPTTRLVSVEVTPNIVTPCKLNRPGCAYPSDSKIFLSSENGLDLLTILHEFGHIFGIADYYYDPETNPQAELKKNVVTGCKLGFFGSIMCVPKSELGPSDKVAIRKAYCGLTDDPGCPIPHSFRNDFFDTTMISCTANSIGESNSLSLEFSVTYYESVAEIAQYPYQAKLTLTDFGLSSGDPLYLDLTAEISTVDFTSDIAPTLEFKDVDGVTFLTWILAIDVLQGKIESDDKLQSYDILVNSFSARKESSCQDKSANFKRILSVVQ